MKTATIEYAPAASVEFTKETSDGGKKTFYAIALDFEGAQIRKVRIQREYRDSGDWVVTIPEESYTEANYKRVVTQPYEWLTDAKDKRVAKQFCEYYLRNQSQPTERVNKLKGCDDWTGFQYGEFVSDSCWLVARTEYTAEFCHAFTVEGSEKKRKLGLAVQYADIRYQELLVPAGGTQAVNEYKLFASGVLPVVVFDDAPRRGRQHSFKQEICYNAHKVAFLDSKLTDHEKLVELGSVGKLFWRNKQSGHIEAVLMPVQAKKGKALKLTAYAPAK